YGHVDPHLQRRPHEARTRVVDPRHPRVAHECEPLAGFLPRQQPGRPLRLVVLVVRDQPRRDSVPLQQRASVPGVLREHDIGLGELAQHAQRHVLQIPDRCRTDGERHRYISASSASKAIIPAPITPASPPSCACTIRRLSRPGGSASWASTSRADPSRNSAAASPKPPPITTSAGSSALTKPAIAAPRSGPTPGSASHP